MEVTVGSATQYDDVAEAYDRLIGPKYDAIARLVCDHVVADRELATAVVLELSAGTGAVTRLLAPHVGGYIATDISEAMLAVARDRCPDSARIAWLCAGVQDVPLPDGVADVVVSSLGPVQDAEQPLAEARRLLAPGGRLVACTWGDDYAELAIMQAARALVGMEPRPVTTATALLERARRAGYADVSVVPFRLDVVHASLEEYLTYRRAFGAMPLAEGVTMDGLLDALRTAASAYVDHAGRVVLDWHLLMLDAAG